ncbi:phosphatase PAP2 family protein [Spirilliplanes yamanashiensis]|uniref:Phosphatidic acid phosphatase type 2/haloperoxidase domain-containing protein n=1 Tax=Spirilliplanes yamanashiensis TaxID=42233 RepID=A0A8J4DLU2_9ACTN|nr:phosphatase PAP2 family protein [Spirilliplanes yamanashiensis]MDP9819140.1 undecaprenyl-diphosphatase [Spirilliplanes yamanashiensis]GIJ05594.1 hypothetical protein Sya03_49460 [Spirilliplanes yamanashiensis]
MTTTAGRIRPLGWRPLRHFTERSLLGLLIVLAAGAGFGLLLTLVRFRVGPLYDADSGVAQAANDLVAPHPPVVTVLEAISRLGGRPVLLWLVTVAVLLLMVRRRTRLALYVTVAGLGALFLDPSLKALVGRLRPVVDIPVAAAPGNSFPSGHALGSMVAYGALLLVFLPAVRKRWRPLAIGLVALVIVAVGVTRVMLGVHFVSDVLGGWLLGAAWLGVTAHAFRIWRTESGDAPVAVLDGLEPEAARDITPAPDEEKVLPHPWAGVAEILVGWVLVFGTLYAFGMLVSYRLKDTWVDTVDMGVSRWFADQRTPALDDISYLWSKAGDTHAILLVSLVFCPVVLAVWRRWRPVLFIALTMAGELTLFLAASHAVGRPRPPVEQLDGQLPTSAFPSGHIAATMCLWVAIAVLMLPRLRHWTRWIFVVLAVVMPVGVAVSRMYRGMHHPTDFVGAMILTGLWIGLLYWVLRPNAETRTVEPVETPAAARAEVTA